MKFFGFGFKSLSCGHSVATSTNPSVANTNMYPFLPLHSCDCLKETLIEINLATDEGISQNEIWH